MMRGVYIAYVVVGWCYIGVSVAGYWAFGINVAGARLMQPHACRCRLLAARACMRAPPSVLHRMAARLAWGPGMSAWCTQGRGAHHCRCMAMRNTCNY